MGSTDAFALRADVYSEKGYLGREQLVSNQLRIRASEEVTTGLFPYLQAGQELMTSGFGNLALDSGSSFAYAGPGVRYRLGPLNFYGEARVRAFYKPHPQPANMQYPVDLRALAVYGDYLARRMGEGSSFWVFFEPYAEAVFTSGDFDNVILSSFVRGGFRWQVAHALALDLYAEPFVAFDRVRHYYNNRIDVKPSLRVVYATGNFQAAVLGSYIFNQYFTRGTFDANPYRDIGSGVRVLAVISGSF